MLVLSEEGIVWWRTSLWRLMFLIYSFNPSASWMV